MSRVFDGLGFGALIAALFVTPYIVATVAFVVLFPICWVAGMKSNSPTEKRPEPT